MSILPDKILLATDGSEEAELAGRFDRKLILLITTWKFTIVSKSSSNCATETVMA